MSCRRVSVPVVVAAGHRDRDDGCPWRVRNRTRAFRPGRLPPRSQAPSGTAPGPLRGRSGQGTRGRSGPDVSAVGPSTPAGPAYVLTCLPTTSAAADVATTSSAGSPCRPMPRERAGSVRPAAPRMSSVPGPPSTSSRGALRRVTRGAPAAPAASPEPERERPGGAHDPGFARHCRTAITVSRFGAPPGAQLPRSMAPTRSTSSPTSNGLDSRSNRSETDDGSIWISAYPDIIRTGASARNS